MITFAIIDRKVLKSHPMVLSSTVFSCFFFISSLGIAYNKLWSYPTPQQYSQIDPAITTRKTWCSLSFLSLNSLSPVCKTVFSWVCNSSDEGCRHEVVALLNRFRFPVEKMDCIVGGSVQISSDDKVLVGRLLRGDLAAQDGSYL